MSHRGRGYAPHLFDLAMRAWNLSEEVRAALPELPIVPVIFAENVSTFYREAIGPVFQPKHAPNVAPVFQRMFIEFPVNIGMSNGGELSKHIRSIGVYWLSKEVPRDGSWRDTFTDLLSELRPGEEGSMSSLHAHDDGMDGVRWLSGCRLIAHRQNIAHRQKDETAIAFLRDSALIGVLPDGRLSPTMITNIDAGIPEVEEEVHTCVDLLRYAVQVSALTLSFMHCSNINTIECSPGRANAQWVQSGGPPLRKYYVLQIAPMRAVLEKSQLASLGLPAALHICRGHFKDFSIHPLFGKYKGLFWWDAHLRGSASRGIIEKDYQVELKP